MKSFRSNSSTMHCNCLTIYTKDIALAHSSVAYCLVASIQSHFGHSTIFNATASLSLRYTISFSHHKNRLVLAFSGDNDDWESKTFAYFNVLLIKLTRQFFPNIIKLNGHYQIFYLDMPSVAWFRLCVRVYRSCEVFGKRFSVSHRHTVVKQSNRA